MKSRESYHLRLSAFPFTLYKNIKVHFMNKDKRSKKIVAVLHCLINHNARDLGAAKYSGINNDVLDVLKRHNVGLLQMPCPEMDYLGLARTRAASLSIRDALDTPDGRARCQELARSVADAIEEYRRYGCSVLAVLGGDVESPGCAIPPPTKDNKDISGTDYGVFTKALHDELEQRDIHIPFRGVRDSARKTLQEDIEWLDNFLSGKPKMNKNQRLFRRKRI